MRRVEQRHATGKLRRQCRGMRAAAAVGGARFDTSHGDGGVLATIEEMVDRLAMTTGDQHGACTACDESLGQLAAAP